MEERRHFPWLYIWHCWIGGIGGKSLDTGGHTVKGLGDRPCLFVFSGGLQQEMSRDHRKCCGYMCTSLPTTVTARHNGLLWTKCWVVVLIYLWFLIHLHAALSGPCYQPIYFHHDCHARTNSLCFLCPLLSLEDPFRNQSHHHGWWWRIFVIFPERNQIKCVTSSWLPNQRVEFRDAFSCRLPPFKCPIETDIPISVCVNSPFDRFEKRSSLCHEMYGMCLSVCQCYANLQSVERVLLSFSESLSSILYTVST